MNINIKNNNSNSIKIKNSNIPQTEGVENQRSKKDKKWQKAGIIIALLTLIVGIIVGWEKIVEFFR